MGLLKTSVDSLKDADSIQISGSRVMSVSAISKMYWKMRTPIFVCCTITPPPYIKSVNFFSTRNCKMVTPPTIRKRIMAAALARP